MRRTLSSLALFAAVNVAQAGCLPIAGTVELTPDRRRSSSTATAS
jgi:hypothetical protein